MKEKIDYHEHDEIDESKFPVNSNVASASECTGLMPTPPENNSELEAYQQLSPMEIPPAEKKQKKTKKPML